MPVPVAVVVVRTGGRRERPPVLCPLWAGLPLAYVKGSLPFDRSLWHGPSASRGGVFLLYILGYIAAHAFPQGVLYPRIYLRPCFPLRPCIS